MQAFLGLALFTTALALELISMKNCERNKTYKLDIVKMELNKNVIKYGMINYTVPLGKNPVKCIMYISKDGKNYRQIGVLNEKDACGAMKFYFRDVWKDGMRAGGVMNIDKCPIPRGIYVVKNFVFQAWQIPRMPIGHGYFRLHSKTYSEDKKTEIGCSEILYRN